jgi:asparagine synthase (glutamine-hydrolysing)
VRGIAGLVTDIPADRARRELMRMVRAMRRDTRDAVGTWIDASAGVYVGWLARGDAPDRQPAVDPHAAVTVVFSGEEYSGLEPAPGRWGHGCLKGLNGRFHGVLIEQAPGRVVLFNDRFGMRRMYYHEGRSSFYFAAEAKAILAVRPELREVDPQGLGEFVACGCVLQNRTLFRGIGVLPPGSSWVLQRGAVGRKGTYFNPEEWEGQEVLPPEAYYRELRQAFEHSLPRYFGGHEPIGMSLTGGLDTRMIMAWRKAPAGELPCYSFGGMYRNCQDVIVAERVARTCRQPHRVISVGQEFLSEFDRLAERTVYLTDGCADVSRAPDLYVNRLAAQVATVRMTGNYGGEVLRQVRAFKPEEPLPGLFRSEVLTHVTAAGRTYAEVSHGHPLSFAVFRQAPWYHHGLLALEETQLTMRSPYLDNELVRTVFRGPVSGREASQVCLRLIADGDPGLAEIRTDRGVMRHDGVLIGALRRRLLELASKGEYAFDAGMPQWMARIDHLLSPLQLERLFLGRHKFAHFRAWYRDSLAEYVRGMLLDRRTLSRPYLNPRAVESLVTAHLRGTRNYTGSIHQVLTLELVHRLFVDRGSFREDV